MLNKVLVTTIPDKRIKECKSRLKCLLSIEDLRSLQFGLYREKYGNILMTSRVSLNLPKQTTSIGYAYIFGADKSPKKSLISFQMWIFFSYALVRTSLLITECKVSCYKMLTTWINNHMKRYKQTGLLTYSSFMHTSLTKVVHDNQKASPRFARRSNN